MKLFDVEKRRRGLLIKAVDREIGKNLIAALNSLLELARYMRMHVPPPGQKAAFAADRRRRFAEFDRKSREVYDRFLYHFEHDHDATRTSAFEKTRKELGMGASDIKLYLQQGRQLERKKKLKLETQRQRRIEAKKEKELAVQKKVANAEFDKEAREVFEHFMKALERTHGVRSLAMRKTKDKFGLPRIVDTEQLISRGRQIVVAQRGKPLP